MIQDKQCMLANNVSDGEGRSYSFLKHFLQLFVLALLVIVVLLGIFHVIVIRSERSAVEAHELSHVHDGEKIIKTTLQQITSDLQLLAHSPILQSFLKEGSIDPFNDLRREHLNFATYKKMYDQVRYLDKSGVEVVRVNYNNGSPVIVPENGLQNKEKRYYFNSTFSLDSDKIFISPLDLNIEWGKVEIPHKPVIRFGTPAFDWNGHKKGIVLLNYLAVEMLTKVKKAMSHEGPDHAESDHASGRHMTSEHIYGSPMLLNTEGYWLLGLRDKDEWGFMFGNDLTFSREYPLVWQRISQSQYGQLETPQGLFTFTTIFPLEEGQVSSTAVPHVFSASHKKLEPAEFSWKLVSFIDRQHLNQISWHYWQRTLSLFMAFFIMLVPACWYFARMRISRERAEEMMERYQFIVNSSTDFMTMLDSHYTYLAVSSSFCEALRLDRHEILGKTVAEIWGEEGAPKAIKYIDQALSGQKSTYTAWFHTPQFGKRCYDITLTPLQLKSGGFNYCVVVSRDITEKKKSQDKLSCAKKDWERTFDAVPDLIAIIDDQHRFVQVNKAMANGLGLSPDECIGQTCYELVHGTDSPHPECPHSKLLQDHQVHSSEVFEGAIGGDFLVTTSPLHDSDGKLYGSVHVARDISASKREKRRQEQLNILKENLLKPEPLDGKLKEITDCIVKIFDADFARIWLIEPGDICEECYHAVKDDERHFCLKRDYCLHLKVSSGRYTHIDSEIHRRVPAGCYKIGRIASQKENKFLTNDVVTDPRVHDHVWAKKLGLKSFAGYRLTSPEGKAIGVLALFSKHCIGENENFLLEGIAATTAQVIRTSQAERDVRQTRDSLQSIVDNVDAMIYIVDLATDEILMANAYITQRFGEVEGKKCWAVLQKEQKSRCDFCQAISIQDVDPINIDHISWDTQNTIDGRWYECHDKVIYWLNNRLVRIMIATDISDRKETQEQLQKYAKTQKTLLGEVNHRVKNNLSAIIGMLHMEEERLEKRDSIYVGIMHDLVSRIQGLATVHSLLSAGEWQPLALDHLCREIIKVALSTLPQGEKAHLDIQKTNIKIGSDQAHHLALVVNELATNAVKHALTEGNPLQLEVRIRERDTGITDLIFRDNGPGYPREILAGDNSSGSMGVEIIKGIISSNLHGNVNFNSDNGAVTTLSFKVSVGQNGDKNGE
ncbi:MAG: PAS domain S-box protein [Desulfobulbaceae bacterium]|uniref:histidine kinase n=1 Tax=Candidatus Desulfobia pelagia TaxID=2841692 RepID=A0A8J6TGF6_9BACT|nr:PAS domain S-box protein [Candidatus Desulfobia pelagia]